MKSNSFLTFIIAISVIIGGFFVYNFLKTTICIHNTIQVFREGYDLEQRYQEGQSRDREIVVFYYKIFLMDHNDMLLKEESGPIISSLEEEISSNPRIKQYWEKENHNTFNKVFVNKMNNLIRGE
jgi:hypothetical protein